jgi:GT2 family glycosyltransferase
MANSMFPSRSGHPAIRRKEAILFSNSASLSPISVSAVIVSHNEGDHLRRTVDSLLAGLSPDGEIVVVDDASTDGSATALASGYYGVTVVQTEMRLGVSAARNWGAAWARGDIFVFSDAHVTASPGWFAPLREVLTNPKVGIVGPVVGAMGQPESKGYGFRWKDAALNVEWLGWQSGEPHPVPMLAGCFVALRREVFNAVGGFDPGMVVYGSEDAELCLRLWTLGYHCVLVPSVAVAHLFRPSHPYSVPWEATLHNILRLAVVHFGPERTRRVVACLTSNGAFPSAFSRLVESDAWQRRAEIRAIRNHDDDWFCERFSIAC